MGHALTVEPQLGSAGAVLTVLLFIALGMLFTLDGLASLWPWVLAILVARLAGKGFAVALLARLSALGWRQAAALTLALQPMSSLAVLLAGNTFGWNSQLPGVTAGVLQAVLIATTVLHLVGPVLTKWSLQTLAGECPQAPPKGA
jgi:Kef-type K+ transport system membrane component KefB